MGQAKIGGCRAVLDCNVVVSAVVFKGRLSTLVELWKSGEFQFLACKEMVEEWYRVLAYPKFDLTEREIRHLFEMEILPFIEPVRIKEIPDIIQEDPPDNVYLACAEQGKADYLVSGDAHLLKLRLFRNCAVITPAKFQSLLVEHLRGN